MKLQKGNTVQINFKDEWHDEPIPQHYKKKGKVVSVDSDGDATIELKGGEQCVYNKMWLTKKK